MNITITDICSFFLIEIQNLNNMGKDNKNTELNNTDKKFIV